VKFIYELMQLEYAWLEIYYAKNADLHLFLIEKNKIQRRKYVLKDSGVR
jgi:hypothetical protein